MEYNKLVTIPQALARVMAYAEDRKETADLFCKNIMDRKISVIELNGKYFINMGQVEHVMG